MGKDNQYYLNWGTVGWFSQVHYAAAKAGLINLTRSIAKIYSREGITCNSVAPGLVSTDMIQNEIKTEAGKKKVKDIPVGRIATPEEIASVVLFSCQRCCVLHNRADY